MKHIVVPKPTKSEPIREIKLRPNPPVTLDLDVEKYNFFTYRVTQVVEETSQHTILRYSDLGITNIEADPIILGSVMNGKQPLVIAIWRNKQWSVSSTETHDMLNELATIFGGKKGKEKARLLAEQAKALRAANPASCPTKGKGKALKGIRNARRSGR